MAEPYPILSKPLTSKLRQLKQAVLDQPEDDQGMQRYFAAALDAGDIQGAGKIFAGLQKRFPGDHRIRRLRIALCLHQKDYPGAMAAIETLVTFSKPDDALIESALQVRKVVGPRAIEGRGAGNSTISLCMIVRNEQSFLSPCLNSAKALADEIIVIDTGSTDHSAELAKIYGARVYPFQWCDDFSAARNLALEKARGDWVLVLDADEIIDADGQSRIRALLGQQGDAPAAHSFETRNYSYLANGVNWQVNDGSYPKHEAGLGWFPSKKVRLFPRREEIRFTYPVHELVEPAIRAAGIPISPCAVPIHHYGNLNDNKIKQKAQKYFELGYAKLGQLGNNTAALRELAIQAGHIERWSESVELWHRFLAIRPDDGEANANMAGAYWQLGQYDQGVPFAEKAVSTTPGLKEGHYNLAALLIFKEDPDGAAQILERLLHSDPEYMGARFLLAVVYTITGKGNQADPLFERLAGQLTDEGLRAAIEALVQKLWNNDLAEYGDALKQRARQI